MEAHDGAQLAVGLCSSVPKKPFCHLQVLYQVFNGVRPAMPDNLPAGYRALIQACWQRDPERRPSFAEVHCQLSAMHAALPPCPRPDQAHAPK